MSDKENAVLKNEAYRIRVALIAAALCCSVACRSAQTKYVHKSADLGAIAKVAVLPFENVTDDRAAAEKVQKIFYLELLATDAFEVAEPGEVTKLLKGAPAGTDIMARADYQTIGKKLGVDGLFVGTVVDYTESRSGAVPAPDVTLQLRLIETTSGTTVWSTGRTKSGSSMSTRLFGVGGESLTEAARDVVRTLLSTLFK